MNRNPFPGMNPWLEQRWHTLHGRLITYACDQLQTSLPEGLYAISEEAVMVDDDSEQRRVFRPEVQVVEGWDRAPAGPVTVADIPMAQPKCYIAIVDPEVERWVEIIDQAGRLITAIEILSPSNKTSEGRRKAMMKRKSYAEGMVSYVEIDLLRDGHRVSVPPERHPAWPQTPYYTVVVRGGVLDRRVVIPMPLEEPLPSIPVPLRPGDTDVLLNLQPLLEQTFEKARFPWIDYHQEPDPPLSAPYAQWADQVLRDAGLR